MDELLFDLFVKEAPKHLQKKIRQMDQTLRNARCIRRIHSTIEGYALSYSSGYTERTIVSFTRRRNGLACRLYLPEVALFDDLLDPLPLSMKKEIVQSRECRKSRNCSSGCHHGYRFRMDGLTFHKCRRTAFFHELTPESIPAMEQLVLAELAIEKGEEE